MDRSLLPHNAFIDPTGSNRQEVESVAREILSRVIAHFSQAQERSPLPPPIDPISLAAIPSAPTDESQLLEQLDQILTTSMNAASPGYIGHMDSMPTVMSMLGDFIAAALNNNMLSLEMSPVLSRLESQLLKQFAMLFELGSSAGGLLVSGGTLANLQALAVARNTKFQTLQKGIVGLTGQPVVLASEVAHTSLQKATMLLGLGTDAVIPVPTNAQSQMSIEALETQITQAKAAGQIPFCVVATAGTTTTGNIDPLSSIHETAKAHQLWFHVDAAYGGALMLSRGDRHRLAGIETADSVTFNPQKWLYVAKTCVMVLFKNVDVLRTAFQVQAPYMKSTEDFTNLGELSVQGTRHADVLKLWLSLHHLGQQGYAQLIRQSYELTAYFVTEVKKRSFLELASEPEMNIVCFRGVPQSVPVEAWDQWNTELQVYLLKEYVFLSLPLYRGHRWLRAVLLNPYTDRYHLFNLFAAIDTFATQ